MLNFIPFGRHLTHVAASMTSPSFASGGTFILLTCAVFSFWFRRGVALAMAVVGGPRTLHFFVKQLAVSVELSDRFIHIMQTMFKRYFSKMFLLN